MPRERAQDVKAIVDALKAAGQTSHDVHSAVHRPWATYETTDRGERLPTNPHDVKQGNTPCLPTQQPPPQHSTTLSPPPKVQPPQNITRLTEKQSTITPNHT